MTVSAIEGFSISTTGFDSASANGEVIEVIPISDSEIALLGLDVFPPGPNATYIAAMSKMAFRLCLEPEASPAKIMEKANTSLSQNIKTLNYLSGFFGILDLCTNVIRFCNAGHGAPLRYNTSTKALETLSVKGPMLAVFEKAGFNEKKVQLFPGDKILIISDQYFYSMNQKAMEKSKRDIECLFKASAGHQGKVILDKLTKEPVREGVMPIMVCEITAGPRKSQYLEQCGITAQSDPIIKAVHNFEEMSRFIKFMLDRIDNTGYSIKFQKNFRLVLLELITNAIIHGNKFNPDKKTVVVIDVSPDSITVGVLDEGEGYNEKAVPNPLLPENLTKQHGRGLFIVKYFVDEFKLRGNGNCTVVKMYRKLEKK